MDYAFEAFYAVYPKKRSKGDAEKAWRALKPDSALVSKIIMAVIEWQASPEWQKDFGKYIPHPATWLRAKGWEDEMQSKVEQQRQKELPIFKYTPDTANTGEVLSPEEQRRRLRELTDKIGKKI
jgi:hypothetical protein